MRGKGRKERIVPDRRSRDARAPQLRGEARRAAARRSAPSADRTAVFLARTGKRIGVRAVQKVVTGFLERDRRGRRAERPLAAPHLRHAPARRRRRSARRAGAARPRVDLDDADLHPHERRAAQAGLPEGASARLTIRVAREVSDRLGSRCASKSSRSSSDSSAHRLGCVRRMDPDELSSSGAPPAAAHRAQPGRRGAIGSACSAWRRFSAATPGDSVVA